MQSFLELMYAASNPKTRRLFIIFDLIYLWAFCNPALDPHFDVVLLDAIALNTDRHGRDKSEYAASRTTKYEKNVQILPESQDLGD